MKIVKLKGGLGNQMFQYSYAAFNSSSFTSISCSHSGVSRSIKIMLFGVLSSSSVFTRSSSYNFSPGRKPKYVK